MPHRHLSIIQHSHQRKLKLFRGPDAKMSCKAHTVLCSGTHWLLPASRMAMFNPACMANPSHVLQHSLHPKEHSFEEIVMVCPQCIQSDTPTIPHRAELALNTYPTFQITYLPLVHSKHALAHSSHGHEFPVLSSPSSLKPQLKQTLKSQHVTNSTKEHAQPQ